MKSRGVNDLHPARTINKLVEATNVEFGNKG